MLIVRFNNVTNHVMISLYRVYIGNYIQELFEVIFFFVIKRTAN